VNKVPLNRIPKSKSKSKSKSKLKSKSEQGRRAWSALQKKVLAIALAILQTIETGSTRFGDYGF